MSNSSEKMAKMPISKLVINMSLPIMVAFIVHALYNIVDGIFVSRLGLDALNAVSLALPIHQFVISVALGCAVGINALLSKALGKSDKDLVKKIANNGIIIHLICSISFAIFGVFFVKPFIIIQTTNPIVIKYAEDYLRVICCFAFAGLFEVLFERFLISSGKTTYSMISQIMGTILNIIMDPIFIYIFKMGVMGAAIATVFSQFLAMLIALFFNKKYNFEVLFDVRNLKIDINVIKGICGIAIPSIITNLAISFMIIGLNIIFYNYTVGKEISQNIFGIYSKLNAFLLFPIMGIGNGIIPIIAYNIGNNNKKRIYETIKVGLIYSITISIIVTIVFMLFPKQLLDIFIGNSTEEEKARMYIVGISAFRIISLSFVFSSVTMTLCSVFQGMGKGIVSAIPSLARQVFILLPVAYILAKFSYWTEYTSLIWFSFSIAEIISMIIAISYINIELKKI